MAEMIPIEARRYIPVAISEVALDWWIIPKEDDALHSTGEKPKEPKDKNDKSVKKVMVLLVAILKVGRDFSRPFLLLQNFSGNGCDRIDSRVPCQ